MASGAKWYRIEVTTSHCAADLVTQLLIGLGCHGSIVQPDGEWTIVSGFVPYDGNANRWRAEIDGRIAAGMSYGLMRRDTCTAIDVIDDEDWAENWKLHFQPINVGNRFRIQPPWISEGWLTPDPLPDPPPKGGRENSEVDGRIILQIEPGMAFGTGQHATTVLCLELLEEYLEPGDRVIDVGTGSGILAIAAAQLGAAQVIAIDSDPVCPQAVVKNSRTNQVADRVQGVNGDMLTSIKGRVDVVVSNLTSFGILTLCPSIASYLSCRKASFGQSGRFIASGIPVEKTNEIQSAIESSGLKVETIREREGWIAFAARLYSQ